MEIYIHGQVVVQKRLLGLPIFRHVQDVHYVTNIVSVRKCGLNYDAPLTDFAIIGVDMEVAAGTLRLNLLVQSRLLQLHDLTALTDEVPLEVLPLQGQAVLAVNKLRVSAYASKVEHLAAAGRLTKNR